MTKTGDIQKMHTTLEGSHAIYHLKREESGVNTSSINVSLPVSSKPNSNLVSAMQKNCLKHFTRPLARRLLDSMMRILTLNKPCNL
jgi:hypothetical protein